MDADLVLSDSELADLEVIAGGQGQWNYDSDDVARLIATVKELRQRERDLRELCEDRSLNENEYGVELNIVARFRAILDKAPTETKAMEGES